MRYFGVSVMDLMALPEHRDQRLPRIIVYLCECTDPPQHTHTHTYAPTTHATARVRSTRLI